MLLFSPARPRRAFVCRPRYAPYLTLIEPWRKALRSLALKGHRFTTWGAICAAVRGATAHWIAHRHPFVRSRRQPGVAVGPNVR